MNKQQILDYYSNEKLQQILWSFGKNREVVARNLEGIYFKRPAVLLYPKDVLKQVEGGAFSFHCSVEHWKKPLLINERNYSEQRIGFDWVIDIDSNLDLGAAKIAAKLVKNFLDRYKLGYFLKFSGRRGFHFCVFWENFPEEVNYKQTRLLYPELPKILSSYLREKIRDKLLGELINYKGSLKEITGGKEMSEVSPFQFVEVEKDWSSRHLFRMLYSLHEKTNLVSVPLEDPEKFRKEDAKIENVKFEEIERKKGDASKLIVEAYDFYEKQKEKEEKKVKPKKEIITYTRRVPPDNFPPCIQKIIGGLEDGRKRSTFTLISFLRCCNWPMQEVEEFILRWGRKVGLQDNYIKSQLMWHKKQSRKIIPPNCDNNLFYKDVGICKPVPLCKKIKNPLNFAILKTVGRRKGKKRRKIQRREKR